MAVGIMASTFTLKTDSFPKASVTLIFAVPTAIAVTTPSLSTLATVALSLLYLIGIVEALVVVTVKVSPIFKDELPTDNSNVAFG
ncbi:MAG: hypothetical protein NC223_10965 [Butyrivibrio sp.]|nr:hypothetical protein [Butyrivibrio sp.]